MLALFSEDFDLLPKGFFTKIINECQEGASSYDLFGALFNQMNNPMKAKGGRFLQVNYFNGGLFSQVDPIDLNKDELKLLADAANEDWSKVQPPIFGSLFEGSLGKEDRHALGAHFTYESDIKKIVRPTIERFWKSRIENADTLRELRAIRDEMTDFKVLDPACGCGNFLYVAFMEMRRLEVLLLQKVYDNFNARIRSSMAITSRLKPNCYFGIDINPFAVELAKVTLMLAKEQSIRETEQLVSKGHFFQNFDFEKALPLDNLDKNIVCDDALFCKWPEVNAIIGNPPYQSKNKMQQELGAAYVNKVRSKYPDVPGRADYCVYWFRRAHDELKKNGRAGLVGTNTIRQNYSREGGLDYIVENGGTITEAVSSQPWSGDAAVHVSIVNWIKGKENGKKRLIEEIGTRGNTNLIKTELNSINSSLSSKIDLSFAKRLRTYASSEACYQGQTHGHSGFLLSHKEAQEFIETNEKCSSVIFPYLTADELFRSKPPSPQRYVIDFHPLDVISASKFKQLFERIKKMVLPTRQEAANQETTRNNEVVGNNPHDRINQHHTNFLKKWWLLSYARENLISKINNVGRYIVCGQVTKRPIFEFISSSIRPNAALIVFPLNDDYSFGILQSIFHWEWFKEKCSTLTERYRYTSDTVFDTFPWPQNPTLLQVSAVAAASFELRKFRNTIMAENNFSLRDIYRSFDLPGTNPLKKRHGALDKAVMDAYGMKKEENLLKFLLDLNLKLAKQESEGVNIVSPGMPPCVKEIKKFITDDCVQV